MRILKRDTRTSTIANERLERDKAEDASRAKKIRKHHKAIKAVERADLDVSSVVKPPDNPSPYDIQAQKVFAKVMTGEVFTPAHLKKAVEGYFASVDSKMSTFLANTGKATDLASRRPYTIEGLCDHLGVTKAQFLKIAHDESYGDLYKIARLAEQKIVANLLDKGLMKEIDPSITKFYLKNISDLQDKAASTPARIGNITFVTVNSREDAKRLAGDVGEPIDVEAEPVDGASRHDE